MWSSWVKEKGTTQVMYIANLKDGPKRVKKIFSMILERVFKMVWWRGRKWNHIKKSFDVEFFSSLKILTSHFIWRDSWSFLFFHAPSLEDLGGFDDIWGGNHFFKNFFSNGFNILAVDAYSGMELCTPTWLNHDYSDGGVVDIMAVDTYSRVEVCTFIFLGEATN
jgi:hypothetical protein